MISCNGDKCVAEGNREEINEKAYFVSEKYEIRNKNVGENNKLAYCKKVNEDVVKCTILSSYPDSYYVNAKDNGLIQIKSNAPYLLDSTEDDPGYYINSITGDNLNVIVCDSSNNCEKLSRTEDKCTEGVINKKCKLCSKIDGNCDGETFPSTTTKYIIESEDFSDDSTSRSSYYLFSVSGKAITLLKIQSENYYLVSGSKFVKDSSDGIVYKCSSSGCIKEEFTVDTYYSNDDDETAKNYPIIHCSKET